jgi:DNA mismatch repair protein MutS
LSGFPSVSIGVNLDSQLRPVEATLLAIHDKPFKGGKLLDRLMGKKNASKPDQGLGPLHVVPNKHVEGLDNRLVRLPTRVDPLMVPLFRDLYEMLRWLIEPMNVTLKQFAEVNTSYLISLETEIAFYLGAAALIRRMQTAGLPVCRPCVLSSQERSCQLNDMYNLLLALHATEDETGRLPKDAIVLNDVAFGSEGRIFILTGPNLGGKTVYTQAAGVIQVLFQAGLFVPARQASISPVDSIYTHFAILENSDSGMGRLGEEALRLNEIFQSATDQSLVLLNESLASTSPGESLYLARDIVCALRLYGVRAIFATHLHELAEDVDQINAEVKGDSRVISLVAGIAVEGEAADAIEGIVPRTYQIKPGPPRGLSYARGIASRYGISFEQLSTRWQARQRSDS